MSQPRHENAGFLLWGGAPPAENQPANEIDYRARAARLRALAAESPYHQVRAYLSTTAAQFERLADYAASTAPKSDAA